MTVVGCISAKASPGVTTAVQLVADAWPLGRALLVVEADPAGGDLAGRLGLRPDPGLVSLASEGRRGLSGDIVDAHVQAAGEGVSVLLAPAGARAASAALSVLADRLADALGQTVERDVVVDCGRLGPASPAWPLVRAADAAVLLTGATATDVAHARPLVEDVAAGSTVVGVVVVGEPGGRGERYPAEEVAEALGVPLWGTLPAEPGVVASLLTGRADRKRMARSRLARAAADLAARLASTPARPKGRPQTAGNGSGAGARLEGFPR